MILAGDFIPKNYMIRLPDEFRSQIVLANLEGPICEDGLPMSDKVGVCLHTTSSEQLFESIGTFAFSLANNHMMDFREEGLLQTQQALAAHNIPFAGAGRCEVDACKPMILNENGKRVAVFCCCERQFGMATEETVGCAEKNVWLYNAIRKIKQSGKADYVIVSCHAASEFSLWVSPALHDFYHSLIDAGADCIQGHHSHVPQGYEKYKGRPIFYGLGNFLVDPKMWVSNPDQLWSIVVDVKFGDTIEWYIMPYVVNCSSDSQTLVVEKITDKSRASEYMSAANFQFLSRERLIGCWQEASVRIYHKLYEQTLRAPSTVRRRLSMRDVLRKGMFALKDLLNIATFSEYPTRKSMRYAKTIYNYFNCESHVQMISTALGVLTGSEDDLRTPEMSCLADKMGLDRI